MSNIHIGLAARTNSTPYTVGQRISNSTNAYQCATAGTSASSGGPTTTGSAIVDGSVTWKYLSSIDYTSLAAWVASIPSTLTAPIRGELWNNGTLTTTTGVPSLVLSGHTTTPTNTITLTCAVGESIRDSLVGQVTPLTFNAAKGVSFTLPSSGSGGVNYLDIGDSNVIIDGIQIIDPNSGSNSTLLNFTGDNAVCSNCILDGYSQSGGATILGGNIVSGSLTVTNTLIVDRVASPGTACGATYFNYTTVKLINNTLIALNAPTDCVGWGCASTGGTAVIKNCLTIGYTAGAAVQSGGTAVAVDHSLWSSASLTASGVTTGTGNLFSKTAANQFVSATTNFRLKAGADAIDVGTTDTTDIPTGDDIARTIRSSWDMGAHEYFVPPTVNNGPRIVMCD